MAENCGGGGHVIEHRYGYTISVDGEWVAHGNPWSNSAQIGQTITFQITKPIYQRYVNVRVVIFANVYEGYTNGCQDWRQYLTVEDRSFSLYLPGGPTGTELLSIPSPNPVGVNEELTISLQPYVNKKPSVNEIVSQQQKSSTNPEFKNEILSRSKTLKIYNNVNNEISSTQFLEDDKTTLTTSGLKSGIYFYRIIDDQGKPLTSGKFVVTD